MLRENRPDFLLEEVNAIIGSADGGRERDELENGETHLESRSGRPGRLGWMDSGLHDRYRKRLAAQAGYGACFRHCKSRISIHQFQTGSYRLEKSERHRFEDEMDSRDRFG